MPVDGEDGADLARRGMKGLLVIGQLSRSSYRRYALPETFQKMLADREASQQDWEGRLRKTGYPARDLPKRLEAAGALGAVTSLWSRGWGVNKIFHGRTRATPSVDVSCEDYGLLYRMTDNGQNPVLRISADAEFLGAVPSFNVIGEITGVGNPDQSTLMIPIYSWAKQEKVYDQGLPFVRDNSVRSTNAEELIKTEDN